jgi:predicted PurR-regulated permease PerM
MRPSHRTLFLATSALLVVVVLVAARAVLLPFVLALVVAYVLTPAVTRVEQRGVPRWVAILLVYALTLGAISGFVAMIVPRLVIEGRTLAHEAPNLKRRLRDDLLPKLDERIRGWMGAPAPAAVEPRADAPYVTEADEPREAADPAKDVPIRLISREGGVTEVVIDPEVRLRKVGDDVWQLERVEKNKPFSSGAALSKAVDKASDYLKANSLEVLRVGREIVSAISRGIFNLFMTLMLGAYMMLTREKILDFLRELFLPQVPGQASALGRGSQDSFDRFMRRLDRGLSGVVRGQLLICLVNGVLSAIGFWLFDLKYWPIMSVLAGVMSLIPIFGSILSSIPAVAIGLTQSPGTGLAVLAWIVGIHQLEANFLNPKIIGDSAKIHPVLVVFSLLVGEHFFQITGALFAVPCMSIAQTIFLHFRESALGLTDPMASHRPPPSPSLPSRLAVIPPPAPTGFKKSESDKTLRSLAKPALTPTPSVVADTERKATSSPIDEREPPTDPASPPGLDAPSQAPGEPPSEPRS